MGSMCCRVSTCEKALTWSSEGKGHTVKELLSLYYLVNIIYYIIVWLERRLSD